MKKSPIIILFFICFTLSFAKPNKTAVDPKKEKKIFEIICLQLKNKHLIEKKIDDNFSKKVFKTYIDSIDKYKLFFLESDILEFKKFENQIDDQIKKNDLTFFYMTYDRIKLRMTEGKEIYTNLLKNKINLNEKNKVFDEKNMAFQKTKSQQIEQWKNFIKSEILSRIVGSCLEENKKNKLNKKDLDENFNEASKYFLENFAERIEITTLNIENFSRLMFFEEFMNAIIYQYDRHSKYFIPRNRDEYLIRETGKNEGIGVMTSVKDNFVQINSITNGGPAWKTKKLDAGDVILKVGQENQEPIDVVGFALYEVAKLTRGKSGTNVKLTVKKINGSIETVTVKRAVVSSNDSYIKSCLVEKNKVKYGIISFPRFYNDFDDDLVRNVVNDFEEELEILKESGAEGIVIDIRNNGGGSVEAAAKILSNFIGKNTILQVKNKENKIFKLETENETKKWDKSLVLLVNHNTASAAEIFASAFQEFNIGIILGRETFGKGTVQEMIDLNDFNSKKDANDDFGMLKISTQRFYKIDGKSVQLKGVIPNITFPKEFGENREKNIYNPLPSDVIKSDEVKLINPKDYYSKIIKNCEARISSNPYFNEVLKSKSDYYNFKFSNTNSELLKNELFKFIDKYNSNNIPVIVSNLEFKSTPADVKLFKRSSFLINKRKDWYNSLKTDNQIDECLNVLEDIYLKK
jgi:carboxyl-terminal processing protease